MDAILCLIRTGPRSPQARSAFETIDHLSRAGHPVSVFLLQDGVLAGLDSPAADAARALAPHATFHVLTEDLALRGFCDGDLAPGVQTAGYAVLSEAPDFSPAATEPPMRALAESLGLKPGQLFGILRVAVTGQKVSPPLFESMEIIGRQGVLERLERAKGALEAMPR